MLKPEVADQETTALRQVFAQKRNLMLEKLKDMGIACQLQPGGTFYVWVSMKRYPRR